ncbi:MAG TPA: RnfABCDGE type electron transport complex subunit D [Candidatus Rifleibacterium sp.]|nr:RnfABCDGE type electron transport complex subunit D [Candidatus Rifleibacterium sp.]HPT44598.1 RnfABCDGE type electron transport complex subunit D [Candidatus Rifleibacterium sp.]
MATFLNQYVQYQKPQISMLAALSLPLAGAVYNFGWRSAVFVFFSMFCCWLTEYLFTRRTGKPASAASLVTGALLGLICPPNVPFWQIAVGGIFCTVFAKMAFGGFGKNIFNPAMVGRCFLYISFPATLAATWYVPFQGGPAGFAAFTTQTRTAAVDTSMFNIDAVTSATTLTAAKRLNMHRREALAAQNTAEADRALQAFSNIPITRLFFGNINGCLGETSSLLIILSMAYLLYQKILFIPLLIGPLIGILLAKLMLHLAGLETLPLVQGYLVNLFAGGTLFAAVFMVTEPITAPMNNKARWVYAILIGFLAAVIRSLSAFNAGFMFAILLGNTFGPIIEIGIIELEKLQKKEQTV